MNDVTTPAVTTAVTGIDTFFYDVSQYENETSGFFSSISEAVNVVITAIQNCFKYFQFVGNAVT